MRNFPTASYAPYLLVLLLLSQLLLRPRRVYDDTFFPSSPFQRQPIRTPNTVTRVSYVIASHVGMDAYSFHRSRRIFHGFIR